MGYFSFKTQDTNKSIANVYSKRETFRVTMTDNKGNKWHEDCYEGYGIFGGKDYYELLAEMNGLKDNVINGIELSFSGKPHITPNLTESKEWKWVDKQPEMCELQGFFY